MKSPFKFLDSFTRDDREIFFGRDREIKELYQRLFESNMMLVYGISGTGKSSLVNCGLANKINETDWLPISIRRGRNIVESMAAGIKAASVTPQQTKLVTPADFKKGVRSLYLDYYKLIFFIFDQFEELFIFGSKDERKEFIQIVKSLSDPDLHCHFIFIMREEYMAGITEFEKYIPTIFSNRVRIEKMSHQNAAEAIKGPCKVFNINLEDGFAEALLEKLSPGSEDVELTYLQVFLDKIFRMAMGFTPPFRGAGGSSPVAEGATFTLSLLEKTGNVTDLLGNFLDDQISQLPDPETAITVLKAFVSARGTKRPANAEEVREYTLATGNNIDNRNINELLNSLVNLRILQDKDNNGRHELKHDALASKIFEKITLVEKELLEIRQLIENSYHGWQKRGVLLSAEDLKYMAPYESRLFLPEDHKRFIEKSKSELTRARRRRRNIVSAASLLLIIILSALSIWAIKERKNAIEKEELANEERIKAEASEKEAVRARDMAIESDRRAVAAGNEALKARDAARASETRALYEKSIAEKRETEARANNFNFMSKEMVPQDPTVALRLALHSRALNPYNKSISDNLNRIYYDNSFYKVFLRYEPGNLILISPDWAKIVTTNRRTGIITDLGEKKSYYLIGHLLRGFTTNVHKFARYGYDDILSIALSPDGKTILTGSGDKTARLWDMKGNILQVFRGHISAVYTVAFSPDGQSILTGAGDFSAKLWNQGGNVIQTFTGHNNIVNTVAFSPDGRNVLTGSGDSTAILWDMKGNVIQKFTGHTGPVRKVAFFPGGKTIVTGANDHTARIWDLSGNILHVLTGHTDNIISLIISSDGKKIITGSSDKTVRVWDSEGNALQKFTGTGNANYIALSPDETKILTSSSIDGIVKEWDMTRDITKTFSGHKNLVYRVAFSPDGKTIITLSADGTIKLWDLDGDCLQTINTYSNDVVMSPDGKTLLTGFLAAQIFDLNGKAVKSFVGQARGIRSVAFSPDGKTILTGAADNTVRLWDLEARILQIFSGHTDIVSSVSFSPDGNTILTGSYDNSVRLWDLKGNLLNILKGHTNGVEKAEFSQDGRTILSGSNDKTAILWDLKGDIIRVFSGHTGAVNSVCFSPDGKNIVTASSDRTVRIWDTDGNTLQIERGYKNSVYSVAFSPDGKTILTGSGDNTAKLIYLKKPLDRFLKDSDSEDLNIEQKLQYGIINASEAVNETDYNNLFAGLKFCLSQAALQNKSTPDYLNTANILFRKVSIYVTDPLYRKIFISCGIDLFRLSPKKSVSDKVKEANRLLISSKTRENLKEIYDFYSDKCSDLDSSGIVLGLPEHLIRLSREMLLADTTTRYTVSNDLSGIVWPLIQFRQYGTALEAMDLALAADSTNQYAYTTLPLVLVLNNRFEKAAEIYKSYYKRFFFGYISWPFRQIYLEDLDELEKRHISHPDLRKVRELLKN